MGKRLSEKNPFLRDPEKKKRLMVSAITSSQRQEGIEISDARAEEVYKIVFEEPPVAFFRLIGVTNHREEFERQLPLKGGRRFDVHRKLFQRIASAPLCYWAPAELLELFSQNPHLDPGYSECKQGLISSEFDQFVRYRWEVPVPTQRRKKWVPYAKGGGFSRFYGDLEYVFDWTDNGREIKALAASRYGSASRTVKCEEYYFRPGITWTEKTVKGFNARILPPGAIFNVAGPSAFPRRKEDTDYLLGVLNSSPAQALLLCLVPSRSWGVEYVGQLPIPSTTDQRKEEIAQLARQLHDAKATWDAGNEISTRFKAPWIWAVLHEYPDRPFTEALDAILARETEADEEVRGWYAELDAAVLEAYGLSPETRETVRKDLGPRPPELIWAQMEGKSTEQKRMEHVVRLLSFCVRQIFERDDDGILPLVKCTSEPPLEESVVAEIEKIVGTERLHEFEGEVASELRRKVGGYKRAESVGEWLTNVYFEHHVRLYKSRPIYWHLASSQQTDPAFSVLVHYHRFGQDALRKLRGTYVRGCLERLERDLGHARRENRTDDAIDLQQRIEEVRAFDKKLQGLEEGQFHIRVPWKAAAAQPKGWAPDIDDGVKVNILPLQAAGLLRIAKVVSTKGVEEDG